MKFDKYKTNPVGAANIYDLLNSSCLFWKKAGSLVIIQHAAEPRAYSEMSSSFFATIRVCKKPTAKTKQLQS